jgi:DNA-binding protein HU-beta
MNRKQFVAALAALYEGDKAAASHAVDAVTHVLAKSLADGEKVSIMGFGAFDRRIVKARWVRNPRTGERIQAQATAVARFRPGVQLKAIVSGKRDVPEPPALPKPAKPKVKKPVVKKPAPAKPVAEKAAIKKPAAEKVVPKKVVAEKDVAVKTPPVKSAPAKASPKKSVVKTPVDKTSVNKTSGDKKSPDKKKSAKPS